MPGAYFSDQGTPIQQGVGDYFERKPPVATAFKSGVFGRQLPGDYPGKLMSFRDGSLGEYFGNRPPVATAFKSGVFGRQLDENQPGPLMAFRDGSLGSLGLPLFIDGQLMEDPVAITHGQPPGSGGVLGPGAGPGGGAVSDGGTLGPGAGEGGAVGPEVQPGPLTAYQSGILGEPPYPELMPGPLTAYREGVLGRPAYARAPGFAWPTAGLGVVADPKTIDLRDAATVAQVKQAIAMAVPGVALTQEGSTYYDELFYESPLWGAKASELFAAWLDMFAELDQPAGQPEIPRAELAVDVPGGIYPTARGLVTLVMMGVGSPGMPGNPEWFATNFPKLKMFVEAAIAVGMDMTQLSVVPPFFSEGERVREAKGIKMSTVALVGLGVVGVLGAAVVIGTRRKRRT
jgi:hypothetical protein